MVLATSIQVTYKLKCVPTYLESKSDHHPVFLRIPSFTSLLWKYEVQSQAKSSSVYNYYTDREVDLYSFVRNVTELCEYFRWWPNSAEAFYSFCWLITLLRCTRYFACRKKICNSCLCLKIFARLSNRKIVSIQFIDK